MSARRIAVLSASIMALAVAFPAYAKPPIAERPPEATLEFQYGVPSGVDLATLIGKPRILDTSYFVFTDAGSGESRISGFVDAVAVYPVSIDDFLDVMLDYEAQATFIPYFLEVSMLEHGDSEDLLLYKTGIKFLGIEVSYASIFGTTFDRLEGGAVGFRSRLVESLDGKEYEHFTSYYFMPVTVNGENMTLVRYFNRPGIRRPSFGMLQVLRLFIPTSIGRFVSAIGAETVRRSKL